MFFDLPFHPSHRALAAAQRDLAWELREKAKNRPLYDSVDHPNGLIDLSHPSRGLMSDWVERFIASLPPLQASQILSSSQSSNSDSLLQAAATFFNTFFQPSQTVHPSEILGGDGSERLLDLLIWTLCDTGDALLIVTPTHSILDLNLRADVTTIPVFDPSVSDPSTLDGVSGLLRALDAATDGAARRRGVRCRALLLTNPAAPHGRCYSLKTLAKILAWCARREVHLIINEVHSLSILDPSVKATLAGTTLSAQLVDEQRTSILSLPFSGGRPPQNVHCIYSPTKDLGMNGIQMGFLVTRNSSIHATASRAR